MKRTRLLWITALILGWLFDFLFWKHPQGLNFPLYALLVLTGGLVVLLYNGFRPSYKSLILLIPLVFFAAISLFRQEPLSLFLSFAFTLGLMGLLAVTFLGGRWPWYGLADYLANYARLAGSLLARPLMFLSENRKNAAAATADADQAVQPNQTGRKRFWAVLRGLLIALPILAVFTALLASADLVFAQRVSDFGKLFRLERLPEYIFRLVYICIGAYALAGAFLHAAQKSRDENLLSEKTLLPQFLGFTEAAVVLGAVVLLFLLFVIVQFQYFFGGGANIGVQGFTYSEYARRGFGELVGVALCALLLFLGLSAITRRASVLQQRTFSGLGIGMVALVGVMLVSAFQRLLLYEAAYGFSRLRMYTHVFILWLGLLLAAVVLLELLRRARFFPFAALMAAIGFAATLTLVNVDASIVRQNVARAAASQGLDVVTLAALSTDSVPALTQAFQDPDLPAVTRDAAGAALACRSALDPNRNDPDWRSFTFSRFLSERALAGVQSGLAKLQD